MGLTATWLGLRVFGFRRWKVFVGWQGPHRDGAQAKERSSGITANRIVQLESAAARNLFFRTNCLERSLVLRQILRRQGFPAELKIGARKEAGRFEAHAWVELEGRVLSDETDEQREFVPLENAVNAMKEQAE